MEKRLYVGNLSYNSTEDEILELFQQAGTVISCQLMLDKFTSRSRGFAFVEMESVEEAHKAEEMLNEFEFQGRPLRVNIARPREERPPRRGRNGDRERN
ncbi:MAG TPA: RNA-binding protein [Pontiella sp.]